MMVLMMITVNTNMVPDLVFSVCDKYVVRKKIISDVLHQFGAVVTQLVLFNANID